MTNQSTLKELLNELEDESFTCKKMKILPYNFNDKEEIQMINDYQHDIMIDSMNEILNNKESYNNFNVKYCDHMHTTKGEEKKVSVFNFLHAFGCTIANNLNKYMFIYIEPSKNYQPYFDFDCYDDEKIEYDLEKRNDHIETIIKLMNHEFPKGNILYSENHRLDKGKGENSKYKYSYQVIVNGYKTTCKELMNFICNLKDVNDKIQLGEQDKNEYEGLKTLKDFEIINKLDTCATIYPVNEGCFKLRFGASKKDEKAQKYPILSDPSCVDKYLICNVSDDCIDYTYDGKYGNAEYYGRNKVNPNDNNRKATRGTIPNKKIINVLPNEPICEDENLNEDRIKILEYVVMNLDVKKYCEPQYLWRNVCWTLRKYSSSIDVFELFDRFSQQTTKNNYSRKSCIEYWNNCDMGSSWNLGTLYNYFKDSVEIMKTNKKDTQFMDVMLKEKFWILDQRCENIDLLENIEQLEKVEYHEINEKFITLDNVPINEELNNNILCIKSCVGTGKTTYIQSLINRIRELPNDDIEYNFLSIVSRVSLSKKHSEDFELNNYKDNKKAQHHTLNSVYQLESLKYIYDEIKKYDNETELENLQKEGKENLVGSKHKLILIIDEFNSFMKQFESHTIRDRKIRTLKKYINLINM